jgi:hypothetical protein
MILLIVGSGSNSNGSGGSSDSGSVSSAPMASVPLVPTAQAPMVLAPTASVPPARAPIVIAPTAPYRTNDRFLNLFRLVLKKDETSQKYLGRLVHFVKKNRGRIVRPQGDVSS